MFGVVAFSLACVQQDWSLSLKDGQWVTGDAKGTTSVPVNPPVPKPATVFSMKIDKTWVVFDERGLTVRNPKGAKSSTFSEIPTSPKVLPRAGIQDVITRVNKGEISKNASGVSGWELVDDNLYIVLRWNEKAGDPWLEALFKLDTSNPKELKPVFLARLNGITQARNAVVDELHMVGEKLVSVVTNSGGWGLATWDLQQAFGRYQQLGEGIGRHSLRSDKNTLLYTETLSYGAERAGTIDLETLKRTDLFEARGTIKFVQYPGVVLAVTRGDKVALHVADSGLEAEYPADCAYASTAHGIVVWTPRAKPDNAWLLDPATLKARATWTRSMPAIPILPPPIKP